MENGQQEETLRLKADLEGNYLIGQKSRDLKAIGLFYAPAGGNVHKVAKRIKQKLEGQQVEMFCLRDISPEKMLDYRNLIWVSSTVGKDAWDNEETDEWGAFLPGLQKISLQGRQVALVGLGNHILYPNNFVDGMAVLAEIVRGLGGILIGKTKTEGYAFNMSRAIEDEVFVGLPLDEDTEPGKTEARIEKWWSQVRPEMK